MRCSGWSSLAISACSAVALVFAAPAAAHVVAVPAFLASGSSESVVFSGPNERDEPVIAFAVSVPEGLEIAHAHAVEGWDESIDGSTATWVGGSLLPDAEVGFRVHLAADAQPGVVELQAVQRYPDGSEVRGRSRSPSRRPRSAPRRTSPSQASSGSSACCSSSRSRCSPGGAVRRDAHRVAGDTRRWQHPRKSRPLQEK